MINSCSNGYNYNNILTSDPQELFLWLDKEYIRPIPESINGPEDISAISKRLCQSANIYSYLMSLATYVNTQLRILKKDKDRKAEADVMMSRKDVLTNAADVIKMQYSAISRMITLRSQAAEEMRMAEGRR